MSKQILGTDIIQIDESLSPFYNIDRNFTIEMYPELINPPSTSNQINIYTDGSKKQDQVGSGWVIYIPRGSTTDIQHNNLRLPNYAAVYIAEVFAIKEAVHSLLTGPNDIPEVVHIYTNSQSALNSLSNHYPKSMVVIDTIKVLNSLGRITNLHLRWIKGHAGHIGNEFADTQDKRGV